MQNVDTKHLKCYLAEQADYVASLACDGLFPMFKTATSDAGTVLEPVTGLFSTLEVLARAGDMLPTRLRDAALAVVLDSRLPNGMWAWEDESHPPPDLDSTAMAAAVLAIHRPGTVGPHDAKLLRSFWRAPMGPFRTWHLGSITGGHWSSRSTDDPTVNFNALFALRSLGFPLRWAEVSAAKKLMRKSGGSSRYYPSPSSPRYSAWRAGITGAGTATRREIPSLDPSVPGGVQSWAEDCISLGKVVDRDVARLSSGSFNPTGEERWCGGNFPRMKEVFWSSPAVVSATVIQLIQLIVSGRVRVVTGARPPGASSADESHLGATEV